MNFSKIKTFDSFVNESKTSDNKIDWDEICNSEIFKLIESENFNITILKNLSMLTSLAPAINISYNEDFIKIDDVIFKKLSSKTEPLISFKVLKDGEVRFSAHFYFDGTDTYFPNKIYPHYHGSILNTNKIISILYMIYQKIIDIKNKLINIHDRNIDKKLSNQIDELF